MFSKKLDYIAITAHLFVTACSTSMNAIREIWKSNPEMILLTKQACSTTFQLLTRVLCIVKKSRK